MKVLLNLGVALAAIRLMVADPAAAQPPEPRTGEYTELQLADDVEIETGFYTSKGILLKFKAFKDPNPLAIGSYYLCPSKTVEGVRACFELLKEGSPSSGYTNGEMRQLRQGFREAGDRPAELDIDKNTDKMELSCPSEKPENIRELTPEDVAFLNAQLHEGKIKMMEIPDVAGPATSHNGAAVYELDDGSMLAIVHSETHWGRANRVMVRAYHGHKGQMQEVGIEYHKSRGYEIDGLGLLKPQSHGGPSLNDQPIRQVDQPRVPATIKDLGLERLYKHEPLRTLCGPSALS
ncbi:MAG: hypothetical protein KGQ41_01230 [Alphaproteobacteria bacterium]|nr:hypothetical protein [Alphaproteobacteria bacterium]